jgi:hypothetical protein
MKPKPLSALNHFTVPVAMCLNPLIHHRRSLATPTASIPLIAQEPNPCPPAAIGGTTWPIAPARREVRY